jgi:hypothetical protein
MKISWTGFIIGAFPSKMGVQDVRGQCIGVRTGSLEEIIGSIAWRWGDWVFFSFWVYHSWICAHRL